MKKWLSKKHKIYLDGNRRWYILTISHLVVLLFFHRSNNYRVVWYTEECWLHKGFSHSHSRLLGNKSLQKGKVFVIISSVKLTTRFCIETFILNIYFTVERQINGRRPGDFLEILEIQWLSLVVNGTALPSQVLNKLIWMLRLHCMTSESIHNWMIFVAGKWIEYFRHFSRSTTRFFKAVSRVEFGFWYIWDKNLGKYCKSNLVAVYVFIPIFVWKSKVDFHLRTFETRPRNDCL